MLNEFLYAKIHRATVTEANLEYVGSITIDKVLLDEVGIKANQKVEILDINNGERFSTYVIEGKPNSGTICLNGAAARKVQVKDKIIIVAYALLNEEEQAIFKRARNAKKPTKAKHASVADYNVATGFEAILGYLYLIGENERINFLLNKGKTNED